MLCSSPISANMLSNIATFEFSFAGIKSPDRAISSTMPTVLSDTVFPPVFGPVIISEVNFSPRVMFSGTILSLSISGCLASIKLIIPSVFKTGKVAFKLKAYFALAKAKSRCTRLL